MFQSIVFFVKMAVVKITKSTNSTYLHHFKRFYSNVIGYCRW